jgi:hypothetical protein
MRLTLYVLLIFLFPRDTFSQDSTKTKPASVFLGLNQDNYYGLFGYAYGYYGLTKKTSVAFYSIARQSIQIGTGFRFKVRPGLSTTPVIGMSNGKTLSGGKSNVIGEGLILGLFTTYFSKKIFFDEAFFYYKDLRKEGPVTSDYLWYWLTLGYNVSKRLQTGVHYEQLYLSRRSDGKSGSQYQFAAPYIQVNFYKYSYLRFTAGYNFVKNAEGVLGSLGNNFIRLSMLYSFIE